MNFIKSFSKVFIFLSTFFILCLSISAFAGEQPLVFTSNPSFPQIVSQGGTYTLSYTIKNNITTPHSVTLPLVFSAAVSAGTISVNGGDCGSTLNGGASCTKSFLFTAPESDQTITGSVNVDYKGRYPLTDVLKFITPRIFNKAYIVNYSGNSLTVCNVDPTTGVFSDCADSGVMIPSSPVGITFNALKTYVYIGNNDNTGSVTLCSVSSSGVLSDCGDSGAVGLDTPFWVTLNKNNT
ncbi:MAG: hypothetical protein NTU49_01850, partial [Gammaproteobacteria bacterium]|nr:hypothetical protein [Gammaproteobacteria bacterium]